MLHCKSHKLSIFMTTICLHFVSDGTDQYTTDIYAVTDVASARESTLGPTESFTGELVLNLSPTNPYILHSISHPFPIFMTKMFAFVSDGTVHYTTDVYAITEVAPVRESTLGPTESFTGELVLNLSPTNPNILYSISHPFSFS